MTENERRVNELEAEVLRLHVEISNMASPQALSNALDKVRLTDLEVERLRQENERLRDLVGRQPFDAPVVEPVPPGANLSATEIMARSAGIERPGEK